MNRALLALLTAFVVGSALGESPEQTKVRITTWNLEWFPNGSAHDATPEIQAQRIAAAADVLRPINPDVILLQEVRDYDVCARLGEAIAPGVTASLSQKMSRLSWKARPRARLRYGSRLISSS